MQKKLLTYPSHYRLLTKTDFKSVFDNAKKISHKHMLLLYTPNQQDNSRLGLVIGKRFVNKAVSRNRIKRVIRESFRHHCENFKNMDIIVIARYQCDSLSKQKLREGLNALWEKLKTSH